MAITAKGYLGLGATGGTTGAIVFAPGVGKVIRVTGILISNGSISGSISLYLNDGTTSFTLFKNIPILAEDSVDFTVEKPVNVLSGWTLSADLSEGLTLSVSGEEF